MLATLGLFEFINFLTDDVLTVTVGEEDAETHPANVPIVVFFSEVLFTLNDIGDS